MIKVEIQKLSLIENDYFRDGCTWSAVKLIEAAKQCEVFDLPLAGISLDVRMWGGTETIHGFLYHAHRIENADLTYPIILDDRGTIADGWHRVCKAILQGHETIKAVRLNKMPSPDSIESKKEE